VLEVNNPTVVAIIPCLNEELTLASVVTELREQRPDAHIVVVDNGSTDGTRKLAENLSCQLITQPRLGKGHAFRAAINQLDYDLYFMVDGDNTYGLENLNEAICKVSSGEFEMVVGKRVADKHAAKGRGGHNFGNWFFTKLTKIFFHNAIEDSLSGYRVMNKGFVKSFQGGHSKFELEVELNTHARILGSSVGTVNSLIRERPHGSESKLSTLRDGLRIIARLSRLFKNERPIFSFSMFALPWFVVSAFAIENVLNTFFSTRQIANFPTLIGGVGCFIVGLNLWTAGLIISRIQSLRKDLVVASYRQYPLNYSFKKL
jgi:glycosyltransferase involved in cell wall biosynthesis